MIASEFFKYGKEEIEHLKSKDPILGEAIDRIGFIKRAVISNIFLSLIKSIIGQQISTKAQETVWSRFLERFTPFTPETIATLSLEEIQSCGITMRKANYIKDIAVSIRNGELDLDKLEKMSDEDVSAYLCKIKGVGVWTAEMLMIFSMKRADILSYGDLAILRGMRMLYGYKNITKKIFNKHKEQYSPYATVASLYLWAIAGGACPELTDPSLEP